MLMTHCALPQEIQPSGPNGATVTVGDYVRDLLLEQVSSRRRRPAATLLIGLQRLRHT